MTVPKALIFGVSGQDGAYLAASLLAAGYEVHGTCRDTALARLDNLGALTDISRVKLHSVAVGDFRSVLAVIAKIEPAEIYNLAAQSSVGLSFEMPIETFNSIALPTLNILEVMRFTGLRARFFNASSSEMFGETCAAGANETSAFHPKSPYATAKAAAYWEVRNYRDAYGLFACSGILFNHESPYRPNRFVTRKIVNTVIDIASGQKQALTLGNISVIRDWGWAPEYVDAMRLMLQQDEPDDYVIATGLPTSLETFVSLAFRRLGLDWRKFVNLNATLHRPLDLQFSVGDSSKAAGNLGWSARTRVPELVSKLIDAELERRRCTLGTVMELPAEF